MWSAPLPKPRDQHNLHDASAPVDFLPLTPERATVHWFQVGELNWFLQMRLRHNYALDCLELWLERQPALHPDAAGVRVGLQPREPLRIEH